MRLCLGNKDSLATVLPRMATHLHPEMTTMYLTDASRAAVGGSGHEWNHANITEDCLPPTPRERASPS